MSNASTTFRVLAWLLAVSLFLASLLSFALVFELIAKPPELPPDMDFVERLIAVGDFERQMLPVDAASTLLFALAFFVLALFVRPLIALGPDRDPRGWVAAAALLVAAVLGLVAQAVYGGANDVRLGIAYCDCGYKVEEVIGQSWAWFLIQGAVDMLINMIGVALLVGFVAAGALLGGTAMPSGWRLLSYLISIALAFSIVVGVLDIEGPIGPLLLHLETGILVPVWAAWLALRAPTGSGGGGEAAGAAA